MANITHATIAYTNVRRTGFGVIDFLLGRQYDSRADLVSALNMLAGHSETVGTRKRIDVVFHGPNGSERVTIHPVAPDGCRHDWSMIPAF